jgi:chemotaxis methyl-accepting protein methylase
MEAMDRALASRVRGVTVNLVTQRLGDEEPFDLAIATNVLLYWPRQELVLGLNNIHKLLRPGGYLIHNDMRGEMEEFTAPLDFGPIDGRVVRMPGRGALYEAFALHRRGR